MSRERQTTPEAHCYLSFRVPYHYKHKLPHEMASRGSSHWLFWLSALSYVFWAISPTKSLIISLLDRHSSGCYTLGILPQHVRQTRDEFQQLHAVLNERFRGEGVLSRYFKSVWHRWHGD